MSILDDYEEISFSDNGSVGNRNKIRLKRKFQETPEKRLANQLKRYKSNPETYDYEKFMTQVNRPLNFNSISPPVVERILFNHQLSLNKKNFLIQQKECEETKFCTFRPEIKRKEKRRLFKDFYDSQKCFLSKKEENLEKIRVITTKKISDNEKSNRKKVEISPGSRLILKRMEKSRSNNIFLPDSKEIVYNSGSLSSRAADKKGRPPLPKHN